MRKMALISSVLAIAAGPLLAQGDPPSRVARLNYLSGSVSFRPGSVEEWTAATLNYPLSTGDHLWADADARTEMHVGSTAIRMAPQTAMAILNLDDRVAQLSLTQGALNIRLRQLAESETFEIDTPNVAVTLLRPGNYRIDADGNTSMTAVAVWSGDAQVTGGGAAFGVHAGGSARAVGTEAVSPEMGPTPMPSDFDRWCEARDQHEDQARISARYVPRDMIGYEDLDQYGVWSEVPPYGPVWRPTMVPPGWAPYRYGHWAWVEPWGWTWIDDEPWGFAPFHYGRWVVIGGAWVWVPGAMVAGVRPVYAPALVAFVGGPGFGVAVGGGGAAMAAWFPLGPREVYVPAYHVSEVYVRQVNVASVAVVGPPGVANVRYVNQAVPGAVTVVTRETFVSAAPVRSSVVAMDSRGFVGAPVLGAAAPIAPVRVSVLAHAGPAVAVPPARFVERTVVVRNTPPPPPVSFAARQQALAANPGHPLDPAQMERFRAAAPAGNPMVRTAGSPAPGALRNDRPAFAGSPNRPAAPAAATPQRVEAAPARNDRPAAQERAAEKKEERKTAKKEKKKEEGK